MTERAAGTADDHDVVDPPAQEQADPAVAKDPPVKGLERRRGVRGWLASPWLAWGVAAAAIAFAVFAGVQWADLYAADRDRDAVREAARAVALRLTTFEGADIEEWFTRAEAQATGNYATQLTEVFDQRNRDALREIEVVSRGEVQNLFVQDVEGDTARAFAVVRQTYVNANTPDPVEDELRVDMELTRVDGRWLASEVAVLGPAGVLAPTGDPTPAPGPGDE